jgi:ribulose-phosphate 3-epimerase
MKRKIKIAPSLLSADFLKLKDELRATEEAGADMFHVDVMDGRFVPNITIGPFIVEFIKKAATLPLDVHLMIEKPERYAADFIKAGADYLSVHIEASLHLNRTVALIKEQGARAGACLNPSTPVSMLEDILPDLDLVVLMSVNPGFGGQKFIPQSLNKIKSLRAMINKRNLPVQIEVDGGVTSENARQIVEAGADILVMGSHFYGSGDYKGLMKKLRKTLG